MDWTLKAQDDPEASVTLGRAELGQARPKMAAIALRNAVHQGPQHAGRAYWLAVAYQQTEFRDGFQRTNEYVKRPISA